MHLTASDPGLSISLDSNTDGSKAFFCREAADLGKYRVNANERNEKRNQKHKNIEIYNSKDIRDNTDRRTRKIGITELTEKMVKYRIQTARLDLAPSLSNTETKYWRWDTKS